MFRINYNIYKPKLLTRMKPEITNKNIFSSDISGFYKLSENTSELYGLGSGTLTL